MCEKGYVSGRGGTGNLSVVNFEMVHKYNNSTGIAKKGEMVNSSIKILSNCLYIQNAQ